jgi:HAE1 family hydrophobic/amphiphilic exporter-1
VATPLEQQMNGVDKMLYMAVHQRQRRHHDLTVTFDVESEVNIDQVNAQNRVSQAQPNLPTDVNQFGLTYRSTVGPAAWWSGALLAERAATTRSSSATTRSSTSTTRSTACPASGQVVNFGISEYSMRIWVKPTSWPSSASRCPTCVRAVQQQSAVNPPGAVGAEPAPPGQQLTYTVRAKGRLVTAEEFGDVVVRITPEGLDRAASRTWRASSWARLNYNQSGRFGGRPAALIAVFLSPGAQRAHRGRRRQGNDGAAQGAFPERP